MTNGLKAQCAEAALQEIADFGQEQEPVAWLRIQEHENRPTTIHLCDSDHPKAFKVYATRPQPASSQAKSLALLDLDSVEHMQGGANGPTIRLRGFINVQTGPTAPQPPIDNAFVAEGCEQFSQPSEPAPVPCCGKYETCSHACTPRGKWLGRREAESEIENLRATLELAYGHLWCINIDRGTEAPIYGPEVAANAARKILREVLTVEQRGDGITAAREAIKLPDLPRLKGVRHDLPT